MNRVYVIWYADRDVEGDKCVISVVSTLQRAAEEIRNEAALRREHIADVDGMSMPGYVVLGNGAWIWVSGWLIDGGPLEVTKDELNELSRLLGIE